MAYINGIGLISPQKTAGTRVFLEEIMEYTSDYLKCIDPVYKDYIDPIVSRRMSRLIKMGIASARICLQDAGCVIPDAIITGTGLGSVEDTEKILGDIAREEKFLNPTPFIQSTYNTISSQIAIILKCHGYNSTYVHRTFSFESSLIDALLQIEDKMAENILTGGIDEMTMNHLQITRRAGHWKREPVHNLSILETQTQGALAGEGSAYFLLSSHQTSSTYANLKDAINIFLPPEIPSPALRDYLSCFLQRNELSVMDIDLVLLGMNGDSRYDHFYTDFATNLLPGKPQGYYKHLCGEYHTATGFGLYVAASMIKSKTYPEIIHLNSIQPGRLKNILIYNQYDNLNHSLLLVQG